MLAGADADDTVVVRVCVVVVVAGGEVVMIKGGRVT